MAVREKITTYIPTDMAATLKRVAAVKGRRFPTLSRTPLRDPSAMPGEKSSTPPLWPSSTRSIAQSASSRKDRRRVSSCRRMPPGRDERHARDRRQTKRQINARGAERFRSVVDAIITRLGKGRSVWRDHFAGDGPAAPQQAQPVRAAE